MRDEGKDQIVSKTKLSCRLRLSEIVVFPRLGREGGKKGGREG